MLQCFVCSLIPKVSEKKGATGQRFIRKEITSYRIGTLDSAKYKPAPFFYNYKGDRTRNPEQMFENWKLGFPIGSRNLPKQTAINELSKSV